MYVALTYATCTLLVVLVCAVLFGLGVIVLVVQEAVRNVHRATHAIRPLNTVGAKKSRIGLPPLPIALPLKLAQVSFRAPRQLASRRQHEVPRQA